MRFAWLKEKSGNNATVKHSLADRITHVAYNVVWWIPIILVVIGIIDYKTGFVSFATITIIRACANIYRNNVLLPEQGEGFPFRSP